LFFFPTVLAAVVILELISRACGNRLTTFARDVILKSCL